MTLRIRFPQGKLVRRHREKQHEIVVTATSLLTPMSVMAYVLAFWRLAADVGVAAESGVHGLFSHWQVWLVCGLGLQVAGRITSRRTSQQPSSSDPHLR